MSPVESDNVDEGATMARTGTAATSAMMIIFLQVIVIAMSCTLIRTASGDGWGRCRAGGAISRAVYF